MHRSKLAALDGKEVDATAFSSLPDSLEICRELAREWGYEGKGFEMMIDGKTGQMIGKAITIGPVQYYRLKHLVALKQYVQSTGNIDLITHQPTAGRRKNGAHRVGEMEKDAMVAYDAGSNIIDRLVTCCDPFMARICVQCGTMLMTESCSNCNCVEIKEVQTRYSYKLLIQDLQGMNINIRHTVQ